MCDLVVCKKWIESDMVAVAKEEHIPHKLTD